MTSTLYIVATPIGNLEDITLRAINVLNEVDVILAEDTRVTAKLIAWLNGQTQMANDKLIEVNGKCPAEQGLAQPEKMLARQSLDVGGINGKLISYHQHSSDAKKLEILKLLMEGKSIALVTDAGTPGVSDPGNELISYLLSFIPNLPIIPVPGPSSITAALSVSGFRAGEFEFIGYFPKKGSNKIIEYLKISKKTIVFFDSPYRIIKTVEKLVEHLDGDRKVFLAQEMTKLNERYFRGTLSELKIELEKESAKLGRVKGEIVVAI